MLKENQHVEIKWGTKNKQWFISKGYTFTDYGALLITKAEDLMRTSKAKVLLVCDACKISEFETTFYNYNKSQHGEYHCEECVKNRNKITVNCHSCNKEFTSTKTALNKSKSGNLFCSNMCVGVYNGKQRDEKREKNCVICNVPYKVKKVHFENSVTCSTKCQSKWQSSYLVGKNGNNYRGGDRIKICELCKDEYTCNSPYQVIHRRFCGVKCKEDYWVANTLTSTTFIENRYEGNMAYRKNATSRETKPERMVREWLETQDVYFNQEQGFFRKYFADFYLQQRKAIIEVMGDYWHANPEVYGKDKIPLNESQLKQVKKDIDRKEEFEKRGFIYIEVWERDIYDNLERTMQTAMLKIYPRNDYTQDIQASLMTDEDIV